MNYCLFGILDEIPFRSTMQFSDNTISAAPLASASIYKGKVFSVLWLNEDTVLTTGPEGKIVSIAENTMV